MSRDDNDSTNSCSSRVDAARLEFVIAFLGLSCCQGASKWIAL
jgi:hypothetical protein